MEEEKDIKEVFRKFQPEEPVFVISSDKEGKPSGMIAGWNTKCSHDPPRFGVCLSKNGNTHKLIRDSKEFVIAIPNAELINEVNFFGSKKGIDVDKFEESGIKYKQGIKVNLPILEDATINLECTLYKEVNVGDHILFIGDVVHWHINKSKGVLVYLGRDENNERKFEEF